ncbi:MAG: rhodanese-like domain-containing protein [Ignavibacteriales bacterium]|nr:rhodanese-like domain-containing protein [Ignavibacteriales bacterium]
MPQDQARAGSARRSRSYKDKVVIACCESGMRSGAAARVLQAQGFTKVVNLPRRPAGLARREPAARQGRRAKGK